MFNLDARALQITGNDVHFTERQLRWLEQQYPQLVLSPESTPAEMNQYFGKQHVLNTIRGKVSNGRDGM